MTEKILEILTALANKLGTTAEYLWGVLLKQARVEFVAETLVTIGLILVSVVTYKLWQKKIVEFKDDDWEDNHIGWGLGLIAAGIVLGVCWVARFCTLGAWWAMAFNPEYWALKEILGALGGKS